jgi:DNA-binding IclR family transcriptional regulator
VPDQRQATASPPTDRVVLIVEHLLAAEVPLRVSDLATPLGLEGHGWVERNADGRYRPGPALISVAIAVRARLPVLPLAGTLLRDLVRHTGAGGASLSRVDSASTLVVASAGPDGLLEARPPLRLPIFPPFGPVIVAFRPAEARRRWLETVTDPAVREHLTGFLATIRSRGVGIWRLDHDVHGLIEALAGAQLDERTAALFLTAGRSGYLDEEFGEAGPFAVSYMAAPVFDADGRPCFELELHLVRSAVPRRQLELLIQELLSAAGKLTRACGGGASEPRPTQPSQPTAP